MYKSSRLNQFCVIILTLILVIVSLMGIFVPVNFMAVSQWFSPLVLTIGALGLGVVMVFLIQVLQTLTTRQIKFCKWILFGLLIILQIYIAFHFVDYGRADSFYVRDQAYKLAHGNFAWKRYFEIYSNNVNIAIMYAGLIKLSMFFHLSTPWIMISIIQFIWLDLGLASALFLLKKWHHENLTPLLVLVWIFTIPFYAYAIYDYTDIWVLPVVLMVAAIGEFNFKHKLFKPILLSFLMIFAAELKGNFWILVIAFFIILGIQTIHQKQWKKIIKYFIIFIITFVLCTLGIKGLQNLTKYQKNVNKSFSVTHWIAMASDPNSHGDYLKKITLDDMDTKNKNARSKHDIKVIKENYKKMRVKGFVRHSFEKLQLFMTSSTFDFQRLTKQWQKVPAWYLTQRKQIQYWIPNLLQIGYLMLLFGTLIYLFTRKIDGSQLLLVIFTIGLIMFHIFIWEVEERYSLPLLPILIIFGILGWQSLLQKIQNNKHSKTANLIGIDLILVSIILVGKQATTLPVQEYYISGQNIGSYFDSQKLTFKKNQSMITQIKLPIKVDRLVIDVYSGESNQVKVEITQNNKIIVDKKCLASELDNIAISKAHKGKIKVKVTNLSSVPLKLEIGKSSYSIDKDQIKGNSKCYLQYQTYRKE